LDLSQGEISELAGSQSSELERTHAHAHQTRHFQPDRRAHAAHLALPAGVQHQRKTRAASRTRSHRDAHGAGDALLERDPTLKARERLVGEVALHPGVVFALVAVARMQHPLGPRAVVRE
jgi:hypothetical protein